AVTASRNAAVAFRPGRVPKPAGAAPRIHIDKRLIQCGAIQGAGKIGRGGNGKADVTCLAAGFTRHIMKDALRVYRPAGAALGSDLNDSGFGIAYGRVLRPVSVCSVFPFCRLGPAKGGFAISTVGALPYDPNPFIGPGSWQTNHAQRRQNGNERGLFMDGVALAGRGSSST